MSNPYLGNPYLGNPYLDEPDQSPRRRTRRTAETLPPEEEQQLLRELMGQTWGAVETLGRALDTPGAIARGVLADDPLSGFSWDSERRVTGEELLDHYGVQYDNPYLKTAAGFATELAVDPLLLLSGPMKALTPAGKAAKATGLIDLAPLAATKKMGGYSQAAKTLTGRFTDDALRATIPELAQRAGQPAAAAVPETLRARPLLGPRLSRSMVTLDDVVKSSDDQADAMRRVQNYMDSMGLKYDDIKDQPLGGAIGFGVGEPSTVFSSPAAAGVLDAMDMVGQRVAWSAPVRYGSAWFDKRMRTQSDVASQIDMLRMSAKEADEIDRGRREASQYLQQFSDISPSLTGRLGAGGLMGEDGGRALKRAFENAPNSSDLALLASNQRLAAGVQDWATKADDMVAEARNLGMVRRKYGDKYGSGYSPRFAAEVDLPESGGGTGRSLFNTSNSEAYGRKGYLQVPGVTDELSEISELPIVQRHAAMRTNSPYSNEVVGDAISRYLERKYGQPVIGPKQGALIANFMRNVKPGQRLFSEHPLNAQARAIINHRKNVANTEFIFDKLAETAVKAYPSTIRGGGWRQLDAAATEIAGTTGLKIGKDGSLSKAGQRQIIDRIAARFPHLNRADIDLAKMAIPQSVFDRLNRVQKVFESPQAYKDVWRLFEKFTTVFKSFVLAWPSRHVRDSYSNAFSVWLETGNASDSLYGMHAASKFLAQDFAGATPMLRQIPQYARLATDEAVRKQFAEDAGASGILSTLASNDLLTARKQAAIQELVPGSVPVKISDGLREMRPDGTRSGPEMLKDFFTIQGVTNEYQTKNALLNASQRINDANDSIARLGGFIALMKQGVAPDIAAKRITDALVDYGSLTDIERNVFKVVFPWWTYSSRAGKYVVQHMMEKPGGRYSQMIRAMNTMQRDDGEHYLPSAYRQQFAIRIPDELLPYIGRKPDPNMTTVVKNLDFPAVDTLSIAAFGPGGLDVTETLGNLAQQSHPLLRTLMELASDTDLYSKRPLKQAVTPLDRTYQALFGTQRRLSPTTKAVVQNIPGIQRLLSLAGGLTDQRIPFGERLAKQAINNTLGVQVGDADAQWRDADIDKQLNKMLGSALSSKPIEFIREDLLPELPEKMQRQYLLKKQVNKRQQKAKEKRREAQGFTKK